MFCSSAFSPSPNGPPHPTIILLNSTDFHLHDKYTLLASAQTKTNCPLVCLFAFVFPDETFQARFLVPWHFFKQPTLYE